MGSEPPADLFVSLKGHRYMSLTTFKKEGTPLATPVWFAEAGGRLYVRTGRGTGKVKRIRHDPIVTVAPCTAQGKVLGPPIPGKARILPPGEVTTARRALARKYWFEHGVLGLLQKILRREEQHVYLEINPV